ncbi:nucleotidyltransferase domain-containing protein [Gottfriedia solisilvae]|uniref:Nucleotidyltransferase n=1 Tax=Gottfriedia solisilvae TaxID=1516104 RepID=A0A8J3EY50_9BACI|nr:nucleotidyltransferase domain-containing protein [Gottfriedia solisilvae]GGI13519.1 nucleotidyltransferase [Gottfriedia solisilvae]
MRLSAVEAAKKFIQTEFPDCLGAILSGSVAIGKETATSDLDIVVFQKEVNAYRESVMKYDWMIEVFVYDLESYKPFFDSDVNRARPTLPRMLAEGMVIKHHPELEKVVLNAKETMLGGPPKWDEKTIEFHQYFLSDIIDDFIGSEHLNESICIATTLLDKLHEFILRTNQHWVGSSKWVYREMEHFNPDLTKEMFQAFHNYFQTGEKSGIIKVAESALKPFGGKRFEGFQLGK